MLRLRASQSHDTNLQSLSLSLVTARNVIIIQYDCSNREKAIIITPGIVHVQALFRHPSVGYGNRICSARTHCAEKIRRRHLIKIGC